MRVGLAAPQAARGARRLLDPGAPEPAGPTSAEAHAKCHADGAWGSDGAKGPLDDVKRWVVPGLALGVTALGGASVGALACGAVAMGGAWLANGAAASAEPRRGDAASDASFLRERGRGIDEPMVRLLTIVPELAGLDARLWGTALSGKVLTAGGGEGMGAAVSSGVAAAKAAIKTGAWPTSVLPGVGPSLRSNFADECYRLHCDATLGAARRVPTREREPTQDLPWRFLSVAAHVAAQWDATTPSGSSALPGAGSLAPPGAAQAGLELRAVLHEHEWKSSSAVGEAWCILEYHGQEMHEHSPGADGSERTLVVRSLAHASPRQTSQRAHASPSD